MLDEVAAAIIDKDIREIYGITDESTYAYLVRAARTDEAEELVWRLRVALGWLLPRLTPRTRQMFDEMMTLVDELDELTTNGRTDADDFSLKREKVMLVFEEVNTLHRLEPLLAAQDALSHAQSARASKLRAVDEEVARRIAKAYWASHDGKRAQRGLVKELAREYGVTEATVRNYATKYKPN